MINLDILEFIEAELPIQRERNRPSELSDDAWANVVKRRTEEIVKKILDSFLLGAVTTDSPPLDLTEDLVALAAIVIVWLECQMDS